MRAMRAMRAGKEGTNGEIYGKYVVKSILGKEKDGKRNAKKT